MTPEARKAELEAKVRTVVANGGTCGICGEDLPGRGYAGQPAIEVTFAVDVVIMRKDVTKCLCVDCAAALQDRLGACVAVARTPRTRYRG